MTVQLLDRSPCDASGLLERLAEQPADSLLALIAACRDDPRPSKIDVGVGVYRDDDGATPVFRAVKAAERILLETQASKSYLGPEGDIGFFERLAPIVFGRGDLGGRLCGLQTPGGTGALRLAAELIAAANPEARVFVGLPTWPNHPPILRAAALEMVTHPYFDPARQGVRFDAMMDALDGARPGDVVLLHGCCHNPTGVDLDLDQWATVADLCAARGLLPLIDIAYQGLGAGLDEDAAGLRLVVDRVGEAVIASSCDKNFGLYRERTGALFVVTRAADAAAIAQSNLLSLARANWSMPPDHGAAVVRTILEDAGLARDWRDELDGMRSRIAGVRAGLAALDPMLAPLAGQQGMFSMLPLRPEQIATLRREHGVYMAGSGRINVAGLTLGTLSPFVAALQAVR